MGEAGNAPFLMTPRPWTTVSSFSLSAEMARPHWYEPEAARSDDPSWDGRGRYGGISATTVHTFFFSSFSSSSSSSLSSSDVARSAGTSDTRGSATIIAIKESTNSESPRSLTHEMDLSALARQPRLV